MNTPVKPIRVLSADDQTFERAGIRALLEKLPGVEVVGETSDDWNRSVETDLSGRFAYLCA